MMRTAICIVLNSILIGLLALMSQGCVLFAAMGGAMENAEAQKKIEVLAKYEGLQDQKVAVLIDADLAIRSEFPTVTNHLAVGISQRLQGEVPGVMVLPPSIGLRWQYHTAGWELMPPGDIAAELNVDRVVFVNLYEYRLHPPGNRYEWDGVAAAEVGIIERDGLDPDAFAQTFDVSFRFPNERGIGPESIPAAAVESILLNKFEEKVGFLFYDHIEPKYPDKYRPELDR